MGIMCTDTLPCTCKMAETSNCPESNSNLVVREFPYMEGFNFIRESAARNQDVIWENPEIRYRLGIDTFQRRRRIFKGGLP